MAVVYLPQQSLTQQSLTQQALAQQSLDQEQVAALAYRLWEKRNRQDGAAAEDWFEAEHMLRGSEEPMAEQPSEQNGELNGERDDERASEQNDGQEVTHQAA